MTSEDNVRRDLDSKLTAHRLVASLAEGTALQINIFNRIREIHYAAIVSTVDETEGVTEFVECLFFTSEVEQVAILGESIELLS